MCFHVSVGSLAAAAATVVRVVVDKFYPQLSSDQLQTVCFSRLTSLCLCRSKKKNEGIYLYRLIVSILKMFLKFRVVKSFFISCCWRHLTVTDELQQQLTDQFQNDTSRTSLKNAQNDVSRLVSDLDLSPGKAKGHL